MKVLQENGLKAFMTSILNKFIKKTDTEQISTIDIDSTPTASSNNLVTSGGVASALSGKQNVIDSNNKLPYTLLSDTPTIPTVDQIYDGTSANAQSGVAVASAISSKENTSNKVTSISAQSTDTQYPSAKCVYDGLGAKQNLIDNTITGTVSATTVGVDTTVTQNSGNLITSGAVYDVVGDIESLLNALR